MASAICVNPKWKLWSTYLFTCKFTIYVWQQVMDSFNYVGFWNVDSVDFCWQNWICNKHVESFKEFPLFVCWGIWLLRNRVLFEDQSVNKKLVVFIIRVAFQEQK